MPDTDAAIAANEAFYRAFNQKDFEAMDALWSASDDVACIHPGWNLLKGRETVMTSWRNILSNPGQPKVLTGGATAFPLGDVTLVVCRELVGGSALVASNLFVLEDGEWRLFHHHSGPVAAGA